MKKTDEGLAKVRGVLEVLSVAKDLLDQLQVISEDELLAEHPAVERRSIFLMLQKKKGGQQERNLIRDRKEEG